MKYTVIRIDEDLDYGCEEQPDDAPVMAIVVLQSEDGSETTVRTADKLLYERKIEAGCQVKFDSDWTLRRMSM